MVIDAPFTQLSITGETTTLNVDGSFLVIPTGKREILSASNEFTLIPHRDPFYLITEYDPGSLYTPTTSMTLEAPDGSNSGNIISAEVLDSLGYNSITDVNNTLTT